AAGPGFCVRTLGAAPLRLTGFRGGHGFGASGEGGRGHGPGLPGLARVERGQGCAGHQDGQEQHLEGAEAEPTDVRSRMPQHPSDLAEKLQEQPLPHLGHHAAVRRATVAPAASTTAHGVVIRALVRACHAARFALSSSRCPSITSRGVTIPAAFPCSTAAKALCQPAHRARLSNGAARSTNVSTASQPASATYRRALATLWSAASPSDAGRQAYNTRRVPGGTSCGAVCLALPLIPRYLQPGEPRRQGSGASTKSLAGASRRRYAVSTPFVRRPAAREEAEPWRTAAAQA